MLVHTIKTYVLVYQKNQEHRPLDPFVDIASGGVNVEHIGGTYTLSVVFD